MQFKSNGGCLSFRYAGAVRLNALLWTLLLVVFLATSIVDDEGFILWAFTVCLTLVAVGAYSNLLLFFKELRAKQLRPAVSYLLGFVPLSGILWWCWDKIAHLAKMSG
jgi:hypothetical protein